MKMGRLFAHRVSPPDIENMTFTSIIYWEKWAYEMDKINKELKNA